MPLGDAALGTCNRDDALQLWARAMNEYNVLDGAATRAVQGGLVLGDDSTVAGILTLRWRMIAFNDETVATLKATPVSATLGQDSISCTVAREAVSVLERQFQLGGELAAKTGSTNPVAPPPPRPGDGILSGTVAGQVAGQVFSSLAGGLWDIVLLVVGAWLVTKVTR